MKYLLSVKQLGMLEVLKRLERKKLIEDIINLQYINNTSDKDDLEDCIRLNKISK